MTPAKMLAVMLAAAAPSIGGVALAQNSGDWTASGPIDYSKLGLEGHKVVWADNGGSSHETYDKAFLKPFEALTGVKVISDSPFDYARIKAQVESGTVTQDIITGSPYVIGKNCGTLFEEVPDDKIYREGIEPKYRTGKCAIPHTVAVFVVMYNKSMYGDKVPSSCTDYFDLEKFPGKRGMWGSVTGDGLEVALLGDGVDPKDVYPLDVDRALKKLATIKTDISFYQNLAVGTEGMMNGNYGMMITSKERAYDAIVAGAEYAPLWGCTVEQLSTLGIVKGTPNLDAAFALVGYATTPEAQSARMAITAHTPVSKTYAPPTDPLLVSFMPASHAPSTLLMDVAWWTENFDSTEQRFQQWQVE
jgi:putative spermidine/putrescine transport system substrate-binding protein